MQKSPYFKAAQFAMTSKVDFVVFGATRYTGRIACQYLQSIKERAGRWGIAGRNAALLEELKAELGADVPLVVADVTSPDSLDAMYKEAACVLSYVGPYTTYGLPVVEACVRNGTHYVDISGEVTFSRAVVERFDHAAKQAGVAIVPSCAFDAVPADTCNYILHCEAKEHVRSVYGFFEVVSSGSSVGAFQSMSAVLSSLQLKDLSPTSLVPKDAVQPRATPTQVTP